ncbi:MAG TPA: hypothetical protein VHK91_09380, partial [Flavisolibacter sp.]|nr:hypothetical protein [Flavisolibacter sp.]
MPVFVTASRIFDGSEWLTDQVIVIENGIIKTLVSHQDIPEGAAISNYYESIIAPGLIDLQVYGASGRLFSAYPEAATLQLM